MAESKNNSTGVGGSEEKDSNESESRGITDPRDTDVLCGRGGAALRHPGNQTYRRLVNLNKGLYITCLKAEKLKISRSIVAAIREQNGRFLERDTKAGTWYDIGDKKAIEKTSQALREGQPKLRERILELGGGAAGAAALLESQFPGGTHYSIQSHQQHQTQSNVLTAQQQLEQLAALKAQQQHQEQLLQQHQVQQAQDQADLLHRLSNTLSLTDIKEESSSSTSTSVGGQLRRGGGAAELLSVDPTTLSLMREYSSFTQPQENGMMMQSTPAGLGAGMNASPTNTGNNTTTPEQARLKLDRRKYFARMKYNHPQSQKSNLFASNKSGMSSSDGMPDIHSVGSNPSLQSGMSTASESKSESANGKIPETANLFESRHSLMSGLSKISDSSETNSIFSDLSKKIGDVSTRSIAMSEISNMDEAQDLEDLDDESLDERVRQQLQMEGMEFNDYA